MSKLDIVMDTVTFGGHSRVKEARAAYETAYISYKAARGIADNLHANIGSELEKFGEHVKMSLQLIFDARQFARTKDRLATPLFAVHVPVSESEHLPRASAILSKFESAFHVTTGVGAGSAAAIGSWALVSLIGSASTGASIAGLSGAAATNATLAWFGGGALAAGGAGMAGGAMVLGGLFAVPLLVYSAWSLHSKADEVARQTADVETQDRLVRDKIPDLQKCLELVASRRQRLIAAHDVLLLEYRRVRRLILPYGYLSSIWRFAKRLFGRPAYSVADLQEIDSLVQTVERFAIHISEGSP